MDDPILATLYQRGNVWWTRFTPAPGAAQVRISTQTTDQAQAMITARSIQERAKTEMREEMQSCKTEMDRYLVDVQRDRELTPNTITFRRNALTSLFRHAKTATPRQITPTQIRDWVDNLKVSNTDTAINYLSVAHSWFSYLIKKGRLLRSPAQDIIPPKRPLKGRLHFLRPPQARALIQDALDQRDRDMQFAFYSALHAGLRLLEVLEAVPGWFDLDAGLLHIQPTPTFVPKDKDNRTIPLTKEFREFLRANYTMNEPFLFAPQKAHGISRYRSDFRRRYQRAKERTGTKLTFHDLRRTFASLHVSAGTSIYKVAQWLGDGVAVVERTYGHLIPQDDTINNIWDNLTAAPPPADPPAPPRAPHCAPAPAATA